MYAEQLALYKEKAKAHVVNAVGKLLSSPLTGDRSVRSLMIDIETGGLSMNAPILQLGMSDGVTDKELNIFPVSIDRDRSPIDKQGNLVKPSYKYSASPILSEQQFREKFGDWAFKKQFGLESLYTGLSKLPHQQIAKLEADALIKDTLDLTQYGMKDGPTLQTPRGIAKQLVGELLGLSKEGGNLVAANMPFESARLGDVLAYYMDPENPHNILKEVDLDEQGLRNLFSATYEFHGKKNIMDVNNLDYIRSLRSMEAKTGDLSNLIDLWPKLLNKEAKINTLDVQDVFRMLFSGVNQIQYGIGEPGKDIYTGASIDFATNILFGEKEKHTALSDVKHQQRALDVTASAVNKLYHMTQGLKPGSTLMDQAKGALAGMAGLFDERFIKALNYAQSRHVVGSYKDDMLGVEYSGKVYNMMKRRNMHRSMSIMHNTLDAWLSYADNIDHEGPIKLSYKTDPDTGKLRVWGEGEQFTVAHRDSSASTAWRTIEDNTFKEYKAWATDRNLPQDTIGLYRKVKAESGQEAAREAATNSVLEKFYNSRFFASSDIGLEPDDMRLEYEGLKPMLGDKDVFNMLTTGDREFKDAMIKVASTSSTDKMEYLKFFGKAYGKQVAVLGGMAMMAMGVGRPMLSQITGRLDAAEVKEQDIDRSQVPKFMSMGVSTIGYSEDEIYKKLTQEEKFGWRTKRIFASGTIAHEYEEVQRLRSGGAKAAESFIANYDMGMSSFVDIVYDGDIPSDVKTASPRKMERIRKYGADRKNVSQLNFYMAQMNVNHGYLEYVNRVDPSDREKIKVNFDPHLLQRDLAKISRVRQRIQSDLAAGRLDIEDLPKGDTIEVRALESQERQAKLLRLASRPVNPVLGMKYRANLMLDRAIERSDRRFERDHGFSANPWTPDPGYNLEADFFAANPANQNRFNRARDADDYARIAMDSYNRDMERKESMSQAQSMALFDMFSSNPGRDARRSI